MHKRAKVNKLQVKPIIKNYLYQDFSMLLYVSIEKWDLYSFSILLIIPANYVLINQTGSGIAEGVRIGSAPGEVSLPVQQDGYNGWKRGQIIALH